MAKLAIKAGPLVVADLQHAIFHTEGVVQVHAEFMLREFRRPAREVATVEQWRPRLALGGHKRGGKKKDDEQSQQHGGIVADFGLFLLVERFDRSERPEAVLVYRERITERRIR